MNYGNVFYLVISMLVFWIDRGGHVDCSKLPHVRGIPLSKYSLYNPEHDFQCLDGSRLMSFDYVNDDYCDCGDGSDEPGTAACPNGVFFCENKEHQSKYYPSGRVNDGICDCCDGSDEWNSNIHCNNICSELGEEAKREADKEIELAKEGNKIRIQMSAHGKKLRKDNEDELEKLRGNYKESVRIEAEKEQVRNMNKEKENEALKKYKPAEPEQSFNVEAEEYFKMLDSDENGLVTVAELKTRVTFDKDLNGEVTEEEALFFLNNQEAIAPEEFINFAWANMKPFVMRERGSFKPPSRDEDKEIPEDQEESQDLPVEEDIETEGEDEVHEEEEEEEEEHEQEQEPEKQPEVQYDEETQALIDEAAQSDKHYQEAKEAVYNMGNEIRKLEEKIGRDYGHDYEFFPLDGKCFEYRDLQYIYSLCPFVKASQRSVHGGSEVNLGQYDDWAGSETNKYSKMKYHRGLTCWNGPARNTIVNLRCGIEDRLISVSEPSRCEYMMEFTTPALCNPESIRSHAHEEL